mgnify:CR=1 FL=1
MTSLEKTTRTMPNGEEVTIYTRSTVIDLRVSDKELEDKLLEFYTGPVLAPEGYYKKRPGQIKELIKKVESAHRAHPEVVDLRTKNSLIGRLKDDKPPTHLNLGQYDAVYHVSEKLKHLLERTKEKAKEIASILEKRPREEDSDDEAGDKTAAPPKRMRRRSLSESKSKSPKSLRRTVSVPTQSMCKVPKPAKVVETSA